MNNKKVIVTGGAVFIDSHLAEELARRDYQLIILDDLSTGRIENIEKLLKRDKAKFVQGSVTNLTYSRDFPKMLTMFFTRQLSPVFPVV